MALDQELFAKFERDWNDAMAQYDARTTAARMGNVQYDPASRTFAPQEVDPSITAGIRSELFDPIQSKWGTLAALAGGGRGRSSSALPDDDTRFFQTPVGVFSVDPRTMQSRKIIDVPSSVRGVVSTPESRRDEISYRSALTRMQDARRAALRAVTKGQKDAASVEMKEAQSVLDLIAAPKAAPFQVDPMTIPFGSPRTMAESAPDSMQMFMGDPANPVVQDPPPAPLPVGPSSSRGIQVLQIRRK